MMTTQCENACVNCSGSTNSGWYATALALDPGILKKIGSRDETVTEPPSVTLADAYETLK